MLQLAYTKDVPKCTQKHGKNERISFAEPFGDKSNTETLDYLNDTSERYRHKLN